MKILMQVLVFALAITNAVAASHFKVAVSPDAGLMFSKNNGVGAVWMGYLLAREKWISTNLTTVDTSDFQRYRPRYLEEVEGRAALAELWKNMGRRASGDEGRYLSDLVKVWRAKWMPEYVWSYLHEDFWADGPSASRLAEFEKWAAENLHEHKVITHGTIVLKDAS